MWTWTHCIRNLSENTNHSRYFKKKTFNREIGYPGGRSYLRDQSEQGKVTQRLVAAGNQYHLELLQQKRYPEVLVLCCKPPAACHSLTVWAVEQEAAAESLVAKTLSYFLGWQCCYHYCTVGNLPETEPPNPPTMEQCLLLAEPNGKPADNSMREIQRENVGT